MYEAIFGQFLKLGLKTSNFLDETINDVRTEEELKEIILLYMTKTKQRWNNNKVNTLNIYLK